MRRKYFRNIITAAAVCSGLCASALSGITMPVLADDLVDDAGAQPLETDEDDEEPETDAPVPAPAEDTAPLIEDANNEYSVNSTDYNYTDQIAAADDAARAAGNEQVTQAASQIAAFVSEAPALICADSNQVQTYLDSLTEQEDPAGSDGELEIGSYIKTEMTAMGYTVSEQSFHEGFLSEDLIDIPGVNIVAERGANSSMRTDQILIVAAHYDSKTDPEKDDPLGNDKTGAALLLETARILSDVSSDIDLCFLFFSGEEDGNYGSLRFIEQLPQEYRDRITGVICIGPVGYAEISDFADEDADDGLIESGSNVSDPSAGTLSSLSHAAAEVSSGGQSDPAAETDASSGVIASALAEHADEQPLLTYLVGSDNPEGDSAASLIAGSVAYSRSTGAPVPGYNSSDFSIVSDQTGMRKNFSDGGMKAVSIFQNLSGYYTQDPLTLTWSAPEETEAVTEGSSETETESETASSSESLSASDHSETLTESETDTAPSVTYAADAAQLADLADCLAIVCDLYMNPVGSL